MHCLRTYNSIVGWTAYTGGRIDPPAWVIGYLLFLWQIPHFLALSYYIAEVPIRLCFLALDRNLSANDAILIGLQCRRLQNVVR